MNKYLSVSEVIAIHEYLINEFGGIHGISNKNALESAVSRPQSGYYQNIFEQAAALMESLGNNHPFLDGNKRIAFFATDIFLRMNGYYIECDNEAAYLYFVEMFKERKFNFENLLN